MPSGTAASPASRPKPPGEGEHILRAPARRTGSDVTGRFGHPSTPSWAAVIGWRMMMR